MDEAQNKIARVLRRDDIRGKYPRDLNEDVARAILWLLSDESSYSTGTTVTVSGGRAITP